MKITFDIRHINNNRILDWTTSVGKKYATFGHTLSYNQNNELFGNLSYHYDKKIISTNDINHKITNILNGIDPFSDTLLKEYCNIEQSKKKYKHDRLIRMIPYSHINNEYLLYELLQIAGNKNAVTSLFVTAEKLSLGLLSNRSRFGNKKNYNEIKNLLDEIT